ncbi:MAG: hypothetical protein ACR2NU_02515 [Aeoliella sp.]
MSEISGITQSASELHRPEMEALVQLFYGGTRELGQFTAIAEQALPPTYGTLLSHHGHMTVTLEAFHESLVDVEAISERAEPTSYARQSQLTRHSDGAIVQYGIMRIDLTGLPEQVRCEIESLSAPLGRILIRNNLLREVELLALWRIELDETLAQLLGLKAGDEVYGRSAAIHLEGQPAVDLLEIVKDRPTPVT